MKKIKYFIPTILLMILIFYMSSRTADISSSQSSFFVDILQDILRFDNKYYETIETVFRKFCHFSEYALLSLTIYWGLKKNRITNYYYPIVITCLYAITDEFHQLFVAGRSGEIRDVIIDTSGAVFMMLIVYILCRVTKKRID